MLLLCFSNVTIMSYITIVTNVSVVNKKKKKKKYYYRPLYVIERLSFSI